MKCIAVSCRDSLLSIRNSRWPTCIFIHINKTAGSSIERALDLKFEHLTALEKRSMVGRRRWDKAFKFAFVRNPWDRAVSHYRFRVKTNQTGLGDEHLSFPEWADAVYRRVDARYHDQPKMFLNQSSWLCDEQAKLIIDFVGRFESLATDYSAVRQICGRRGELPHLKASVRDTYRSYYDDETRDLVADYFHEDIARFGYQF